MLRIGKLCYLIFKFYNFLLPIMQLLRFNKTATLLIILFFPFVLFARDKDEELLNHYTKYERAKVSDFSLATDFNVVYMPNQSLSELLSKQLVSFLKNKDVNTSVCSSVESTRNIIINYVDFIEEYGRGTDAYKLKITKNNIFIEFTSSKSLYWAYDALTSQYNLNTGISSKFIKSKSKCFKEGLFLADNGDEAGSEVVSLSTNVFSEENIKKQIDNAIITNSTTVFLELLTDAGCKIKCNTLSLFNPNEQYASKDAVSIDEFNEICEYARSVGVTLIPVLDFSSSKNDLLAEFTGHQTFTVEGLRFYRALLKEFSEKASFETICIGEQVNDELIQKKYIEPLVSIAKSYKKNVVTI